MSEAVRPEPMFPVDIESAPKITLAGRQWPVPEMAIAQAKYALPAMMSVMPALSPLMGAIDDGPDAKVDPTRLLGAMQGLTTEVYEAIATAVFWAVKRGTPGIGRGEFDEMPISLHELMAALPVVMKQVGFLKPAAPGDAPAGEAPAGPLTGTSS